MTIADEFTNLPLSRQRKYQMRMQRDSRCILCGEPTDGKANCLHHRNRAREKYQRKCAIVANSRFCIHGH